MLTRSIGAIAGTILLVGARFLAAPPPAVIDARTLEAKAEALVEEHVPVAVAAAEARMRKDGLDAGRVLGLGDKVRVRLAKDLKAQARSVAGRAWDPESAQRWLERRWRILAFAAAERPAAYAQGFVVPFLVDAGDAELLRIGLPSRIQRAEEDVRKHVRALAVAGTLAWDDVGVLRDWTRARAAARGRREIERMQGAAFWSRESAERWLEVAIEEELSTVASEMERDLAGTVAAAEGRRSGAAR